MTSPETDSICEIFVGSGHILVADPTYPDGFHGTYTIENVAEGFYIGEAFVSDEGAIGTRVVELCLVMTEYYNCDHEWQFLSGDVCVTSGILGVFDRSRYRELEESDDAKRNSIYDASCEATSGEGQAGSINDFGFVSNAGYGNGRYNVYGSMNAGKIIGVKVIFIGDPMSNDSDDEYTQEEYYQ